MPNASTIIAGVLSGCLTRGIYVGILNQWIIHAAERRKRFLSWWIVPLALAWGLFASAAQGLPRDYPRDAAYFAKPLLAD
jgi:formate hydrogenlyase subunit 3/multisubunit Na+/H+ antiporter MnhD subunit